MNAKQLLGAVSAMIIKIALAAVVIIVVFRLSVYAYDFGYQVFANEPMSSGEGRTVSVVVSEGMSGRELAKLLEQRGLIEDADVFYVQMRLSVSDYDDALLVSGVYDLSTAMTAEEMIAVLFGGAQEETQEAQ